MRIKRNDISTPVYTATEVLDAERIAASVWTSTGTVSADWQPVGSRTALAEYGIDSVPSDSWQVFADYAEDYPLNCVAVKDGKNYQCVGLRPWYDHAEMIFVPYAGAIA